MPLEHEIARAIVKCRKTDGPMIVAICGAADLGKSYLSASIANALRSRGVSSDHVTLDSFMMNRDERIACGISGYQPEAYDFNAIKVQLAKFSKGQHINFFPYDHSTGLKAIEPTMLPPCDVLILDGLHSMHPALLPYTQLSVFIYTNDSYLRCIRREADLLKRRQSVALSEKIEPFEFAKYKRFVEPYKKHATWHLFLKKKWEYTFIMRND